MLRWFCATVAGTVVSGFAFLLVTGRYISDGPIIARLAEGRGVHLGDVFVVAGWAVAMVALVVLAWPHRHLAPDAGSASRVEAVAPVSPAGRPAPSR